MLYSWIIMDAGSSNLLLKSLLKWKRVYFLRAFITWTWEVKKDHININWLSSELAKMQGYTTTASVVSFRRQSPLLYVQCRFWIIVSCFQVIRSRINKNPHKLWVSRDLILFDMLSGGERNLNHSPISFLIKHLKVTAFTNSHLTHECIVKESWRIIILKLIVAYIIPSNEKQFDYHLLWNNLSSSVTVYGCCCQGLLRRPLFQ